ncbi:MAG TPA: AbrB/MazE/SpoVT family DNA-binding domain-containing protein [Verrucomicrobiae bacterium]|nr:AbrB/MazE/SpoVT family DNA-binding domain-containing protein [Verrucomicrobiae bacterium]
MNKQTIQVDRAGRVVLPKPIRKRFNLLPGDKLRLTADDSGIRLEPEEVVGSLVRKGNVLVFTGEFSARLTDEVIDQMLEEDRQGKTDNLDEALRRK